MDVVIITYNARRCFSSLLEGKEEIDIVGWNVDDLY